MKRRTVLSIAVSGLGITGAGCLSDNDDAGCPDTRAVDADLENELSHEEREAERFSETHLGISLINGPDEIDVYTDDYFLTDEDRRWLEKTDFTEHVVLALQVESSIDSSGPKIHGVEREQRIVEGEGLDQETFHVYSCLPRSGDADESEIRARLLRVPHGGAPPDAASLTHWDEDGVSRAGR